VLAFTPGLNFTMISPATNGPLTAGVCADERMMKMADAKTSTANNILTGMRRSSGCEAICPAGGTRRTRAPSKTVSALV
jgi:hypothetical protein